MKVADVDEVTVLDRKPAMRIWGDNKGDNRVEFCSKRTYMMKIVSTTKISEIMYLRRHTDCHSGGNG